jgi:hypothetical protein
MGVARDVHILIVKPVLEMVQSIVPNMEAMQNAHTLAVKKAQKVRIDVSNMVVGKHA